MSHLTHRQVPRMSPPNAPAHCMPTVPRAKNRLYKYRRCARSHGSPARFSYTAGRLATGPWRFIYSWKVFSDTTFTAGALAASHIAGLSHLTHRQVARMSFAKAHAHCRDAYRAPRREQAGQVQAVRQISWLPGAFLLFSRKIGDWGP